MARAKTKDHTILLDSTCSIYKWNEHAYLSLPTCTASAHLCWYSFLIPLKVGGWSSRLWRLIIYQDREKHKVHCMPVNIAIAGNSDTLSAMRLHLQYRYRYRNGRYFTKK